MSFLRAQPKSLFAAKKAATTTRAALAPRTSAEVDTEPAPVGKDQGQA